MRSLISHTGVSYDVADPRWKCDSGALLDLEFEARFDVSDRIGMWKYRSAIPIPDDAHIVSFDEGGTPLTQVSIAGHEVWLKQDHLFPSGSYKDRGASVQQHGFVGEHIAVGDVILADTLINRVTPNVLSCRVGIPKHCDLARECR